MPSDADLLGLWRTRRDEAAFRGLCAQHAGLVAAVAQRLGSPDREEAAQAVFLLLARRAGSVDGAHLAGWLTLATRRVVANQRRARDRRLRHEQEAAMAQARQRDGATAEPAWSEARQHLDDALASLSPGRREAVVRFYLQGRAQAEVAAELGCSVDAVKTRVHEALERLRAFFARRGVALGAAALASGLASEAATAEPAIAAGCAQAVLVPGSAPGAVALSHATTATISTGGLITMAIAASVIGSMLAVVISAAQPAPVPAPGPAPAPAPHAVLEPQAAPTPIPPFTDCEAALAWLASRQLSDGSWLPGLAVVPASERYAATATALQAFFGSGYGLQVHDHRYLETVSRGVNWLVAHQPEGDASLPHLVAYLRVLCDAEWGLLDPDKQAMHQAVAKAMETVFGKLLARRVGPGWPATPDGRQVDTRATAWVTMALKSARFAPSLELDAAVPIATVRDWARQAWNQRTGAGFPARTTIDGAQVGNETEDIPGLLIVSMTHRSQDKAAWSTLMSRISEAPRPQDAETSLMWRLAAFWAEDTAWSVCHADRQATQVLAAAQASAGQVVDAATAILAMQVHERYDALYATPGVTPLKPPVQPPATF